MKIGAVYPQTELNGHPEAVRHIGTAVESLGYDYLLAYDHVLGATHDRELDFHTRGRRMDEQIPLLRKLWTEPLVTFHGQFDQIDRAALNPRPSRSIPIWFGGFGAPAFRRAARLGDGFIFAGSTLEAWSQIEQYLEEAGRSTADFGKEMIIGRLEKTPQEVAARIAWCREQRCTHVAVNTMDRGFSTSEAHVEFLSDVRHHLGRG